MDLNVNGVAVSADPAHTTLLELLREQLQLYSVKDGCAPQGQCGCCTVLVDGQPRVACVTPLRRVAGREVTTIDGLDPATRTAWAQAFSDCGASQCGFCSPGIIIRLVAEAARAHPQPAHALLAHLCRCTGWLPILDAYEQVTAVPVALPGRPQHHNDGEHLSQPDRTEPADQQRRDLAVPAGPAAELSAVPAVAPLGPNTGPALRAQLEAHVAQVVGPVVALGGGGFAADLAPAEALVAVPDRAGGWAVGESLALARLAAGTVQGRRSTVEAAHPVALPDGDWDRVLQTSWVDPGYLEPDASWCLPGGIPADPAGNGGDFGAKADSPVTAVAKRLATLHGRAIRVHLTREDVIRLGAKRPPLAAGIDLATRRVVIHVARTPGVVAALLAGLGNDHGFQVDLHELDVPGPPTSLAPRRAGWAEGVALRAALLGETGPVHQPGGGWARARVVIAEDGRATIDAEVGAGTALAEEVLRSYCTGAIHMALSWVTSERINVDRDGHPLDLTLRSLGVLRAVDMPAVRLRMGPPSDGPPLAVSDALFAATAAAVWAHQGWPPQWPTDLPLS